MKLGKRGSKASRQRRRLHLDRIECEKVLLYCEEVEH